MPTNIERAEALLHKVLRISAIRTDNMVSTDRMATDLAIVRIDARRIDSDWTVRLEAHPDDGAELLGMLPSGAGDSFRAAMDAALSEYADALLAAARVRMDWAEEEGEVA